VLPFPRGRSAAAVGLPVSVGSHARTVRLATGVLLALLASCDLAGPREAGKAVAERYFAAVAAENYDAALALYSAKLLAATPRGQLREQLEQLHERCGIPGPHKLRTWSASSNFSNGSWQTTLVYEVSYTKCRVVETLTVVGSKHGETTIDGHSMTELGAPSTGAGASTTV
jgi:hypothetical protein